MTKAELVFNCGESTGNIVQTVEIGKSSLTEISSNSNNWSSNFGNLGVINNNNHHLSPKTQNQPIEILK